MSTALAESNGHGEVSVSRPGRPPKDGETFPKGSQVSIDREHREQVEQWLRWYYPSGKANLADIVHEMMDVAFEIAKDDPQRAETPEQRRERFKRGQQ